MKPGTLALDPIGHRAALVGRAIDALSKVPLAGIALRIVDGPAAWQARFRGHDRMVTNGDGWYRYLDLPAGTYRIEATPPSGRYATAQRSVAVVAAGAATADLELAPTALTGIVSADTPNKPLAMARVRVVDSGEVTYTAGDGSYTLSPLDPGTDRTIELSAQRYVTSIQQVTLELGKTKTKSVTLVHG